MEPDRLADLGLLKQAGVRGAIHHGHARHADAPGVVSVTVSQHDGHAIVEVANRGKGIPPDQIDRVFERFVRLDASRARTDGGMGLGLAIVRSILQAHGGSVAASSEAGGLTTFGLVFARA